MAEVVQVNVSMDNETAGQLDQMARQAGYDNRSAFVRWLIRQEYARRYSAPNAGVSVGEAMAAGEASSVSL